MLHVPQPHPRGQASRPLDLTSPRALFVWIAEAHAALVRLHLVTRPGEWTAAPLGASTGGSR
jgi:hypothetical protein